LRRKDAAMKTTVGIFIFKQAVLHFDCTFLLQINLIIHQLISFLGS
jgi:hypothetical protein